MPRPPISRPSSAPTGAEPCPRGTGLPSKPDPTAVPAPEAAASHRPMTVGLKANLPPFALLTLVNAFAGGMVGLERTAVPLIGTQEFHLLLNTSATSFIVSFGLSKALMNLLSGTMADRYGRKRILVLGWI